MRFFNRASFPLAFVCIILGKVLILPISIQESLVYISLVILYGYFIYCKEKRLTKLNDIRINKLEHSIQDLNGYINVLKLEKTKHTIHNPLKKL